MFYLEAHAGFFQIVCERNYNIYCDLLKKVTLHIKKQVNTGNFMIQYRTKLNSCHSGRLKVP